MIFSQLAFAWPTTTIGWIYEAVGILASLFVFVSFFWSNEKLTRIINMAGCAVFVVYAVLIGSISVGVMNGACLILHVVKLIKMHSKSKNNKAEPVENDSKPQSGNEAEPQEMETSSEQSSQE